MVMDVPALLAAHAALPEPYQPGWGLEASHDIARRDCDDRLAVILPLVDALPGEGPLRILDLGCAQGYFTLAIAHALAVRGRAVEMEGVDYLDANVDFCRALAAHHGLNVKFTRATVDAEFFTHEPARHWDMVLALNVLHHVQQQQGTVEALVAALRAHARVLVCELAQREEALEWVGKWYPPDEELLGAFAFHRRLARFPTHLGEVQRPLYACSDALAWVGEQWFAFDHLAERSHAGVPDSFAGQRRFFFGPGVVIKSYRGDGQYGAFNRAELDAEVATLASLPDDTSRYPKVLAQADDGDTVWLARAGLPGRLLSEIIDAGDAFDRDAVVRGLLGELAYLEEYGFRHADLRCWNVLIVGDGVRLIDFGAMTREPSPLQRVALAAMLLEVADGKLRHTQPFYASLQPLSAYPAAWHGLIRYLLGTPQSEFTYASASAALDEAANGGQLVPADDVMAAIASEQSVGFERLEAHVESLRQSLNDSQHYVESLRQSLGVSEHLLTESQAYAESLRQALDVSQRSLVESQRYVESLRSNHAREMADAAAERAALTASQTEAAKYAGSLRQALNESEGSLARMRRRFRWLKPLWPRLPEDSKDKE